MVQWNGEGLYCKIHQPISTADQREKHSQTRPPSLSILSERPKKLIFSSYWAYRTLNGLSNKFVAVDENA